MSVTKVHLSLHRPCTQLLLLLPEASGTRTGIRKNTSPVIRSTAAAGTCGSGLLSLLQCSRWKGTARGCESTAEQRGHLCFAIQPLCLQLESCLSKSLCPPSVGEWVQYPLAQCCCHADARVCCSQAHIESQWSHTLFCVGYCTVVFLDFWLAFRKLTLYLFFMSSAVLEN